MRSLYKFLLASMILAIFVTTNHVSARPKLKKEPSAFGVELGKALPETADVRKRLAVKRIEWYQLMGLEKNFAGVNFDLVLFGVRNGLVERITAETAEIETTGNCYQKIIENDVRRLRDHLNDFKDIQLVRYSGYLSQPEARARTDACKKETRSVFCTVYEVTTEDLYLRIRQTERKGEMLQPYCKIIFDFSRTPLSID